MRTLKRERDFQNVLKGSQCFRYRLLLEAVLVGALAGIVAILYRFMLQYGESFVFFMASYIQKHPIYFGLWCLFLCLICLIVTQLLKWEPLISGSGIPQVEGEIASFIDQKWYRILPAKMIAGCLCVCGGLSLGREGPSIQLGAMVGKACSTMFHRVKFEERILLTCGAAAGLSAAFNAPLAGVVFALEEVHKNFNPHVLVSVMCASVTGDFLSHYVFGLQSAFQFDIQNTLPLHYYGWLLVLGVALGILGAFYNTATRKAQHLFERISWLKSHQRVWIAFIGAAIVLLIMPDVMGGGHHMMLMLEQHQPILLKTMVVLCISKFLFSLLSFGSGAPGGIFFPLLVLGSFIGAILCNLLIFAGFLPSIYMDNFIVLAMAGFFSAIVRAPITGIILIAEMSGSLTNLLPIAIVSLVAYIIADVLRSTPIYESLLQKLLWKHGVDVAALSSEQHLYEIVIEMGSIACDHQIGEVTWPKTCLITNIHRGEQQLVAKGDTILKTGDRLLILLNECDAPYTQYALQTLCTYIKS